MSKWSKEAVVAGLKQIVDKDGYVTYSSAPASLRGAAERLYGSWALACEAAGVKKRRQGRQKKAV